ncbi:hypothetical protein WR25_24160 [Diploscapter pachys]|uniref:Helicase ATP-binding domain-containing protein n=1 Tax=Diploscapter pachys TaxID=2018661 RepID=A0A2A2KJ34_9BILA|nr:hypothetical protein WR25_24160 [Diploscapter pachys]
MTSPDILRLPNLYAQSRAGAVPASRPIVPFRYYAPDGVECPAAPPTPSPRTCSGVHRATGGRQEALAIPLAAEWTPEPVRGDERMEAARRHPTYTMMDLPQPLTDWFASRGWHPRRHQLDMLREARAGRHALLVATTGAGKTLAGFLPTLAELIEAPTEGLHTLYVSPLKALAVDIQRNLVTPLDEMGVDIRVETRTGDTPSDRKARQRVKPPQILLTTPESLSLLLSYPDSVTMFAGLKTIVVDEVHAFATGKRGDLLSLCMARLQRISPALRRVALSATIADPDGYRAWLAPDGDIGEVALVQGEAGADPDITILLPEDRVPWSGHSGRYAAQQVMAEIEAHDTSIIFCNTRSLAELIFQDLWKAGELDPDIFRPGALDVLAQHVMALACAAPFDQAALLDEIRSALPYSALDDATFDRVLHFISDGGYSLKAYDRFKRLTQDPDGLWRVSHPRFVTQHRLNAGIIVEATMLNVRFKNGRHLGKVEEGFAAQLSPGDTFFFAGLSCEVQSIDTEDLIVRASSKPARIPTYGGSRMPLSTNLATRVRHFLAEPEQWHRFPPDVRDWLEFQAKRSALPRPGQLLVETFPREGRHYMVAYSFEGWNAHQSLGMLVTRRMEAVGLKPLGFVANDYALACYGLEKITDPAALFSPDILEHEFVDWVQQSHLLKRAFREVAVIGGLVERQHPGKRKTGRQVTFSTDLIYDVLRKYEPTHLLLQAAWDDARARMTDVGRLAHLLDRAADTMLHVDLDRITPLAVPVLTLIGREKVSTGSADDALLIEAEALAAEAMRID